MIEIPESQTLSRQLAESLPGRVVTAVFTATNPHKFTWYAGNPADYAEILVGRAFTGADGFGGFVDMYLDGDLHVAVSDGVNLHLCDSDALIPLKYQLLITLDDGRFLTFTVAMYGFIGTFKGNWDNPYYFGAREKRSPLDADFDRAYFDSLLAAGSKSLSVKAFLATQQRIPGLGNGVLQDILFRARIHPKRKVWALGGDELDTLYREVKTTLAQMTEQGGRCTEKDLYGVPGGYSVVLSAASWQEPCPVCGGVICKEAYLGGVVYYCLCCQPQK